MQVRYYNTYNTLNEVKILGHHVMEIISDEHSSNVQLNYKSRERSNYSGVNFLFLKTISTHFSALP